MYIYIYAYIYIRIYIYIHSGCRITDTHVNHRYTCMSQQLVQVQITIDSPILKYANMEGPGSPALPPWRHERRRPQRWRNSAMFSPEMMKQAQNMMANMSPEVRLRGGRRPVGCFGPWIYCGDVFFFFRHRKRNRRTRGWWRPNYERWMNIPRIGLMNIPTTFRKSWDGHSPQKWRDFITLVFIQGLGLTFTGIGAPWLAGPISHLGGTPM